MLRVSGPPRPQDPRPDGRFGCWWARHPGAHLPLPFAVRFRRLYLRARPEPQVVPPHVHDDLELLLVRQGVWCGRVDGEELRLEAGGALLVAPGDRHEDRSLQPVALIGVSLDLLPGPRPGRSASPLRPGAPVACRLLPTAADLHAVADRLLEATRQEGAWATHLQDAVAHELLVHLLMALPESALNAEVGARKAAAGFASTLAQVFARHPGGLPVPGLARVLGLGERVLQQRCRRLLGAGPAELQRRHRLALAREMLCAGHGVSEVADRLGFANPFHFSTLYRRVFGRPPSRDLRE